MKTMSRSEAKTARDRSFVVVENVNHPGKTRRADTARYEAMKRAVLKVLPRRSPGLDYARMMKAVLPHLPKTVFAGGARGPYDGLGAAWGEFDSWITENKHDPAPDLWESYVTGPESGADPATELNRPLVR